MDTPNPDLEKLTEQRLRFLREYLVDFNGTAAAIRAGYSEKSAKTIAWELLQEPTIAAVVAQVRGTQRQELVNGVQAQARLTSERTQRVMAGVAYVDVRGFFREDGSPKLPHELTEDQAAAVQGFDVVETWVGTGEERRKVTTTKVRLVNRMAALDMAAKVTGEYKADNEQRRNARDMTDDELLKRILQLAAVGESKPADAPSQPTLQ
jgi:phage terminase small subunit